MNDQQTIIEFLKARLAEDEDAAKATLIDVRGSGEWRADERPVALTVDLYRVRDINARPVVEEIRSLDDDDDPDNITEYVNGAAVAQHVARHDPARVLREVAAKRVIVAEYEAAVRRKKAEWENYADWVDGNARGPRPSFEGPDPKLIPGLERSARHLAAVYSDHKDYNHEWVVS